MRGKTNTITINGRIYDAATGKAVGTPHVTVVKSRPTKHSKSASHRIPVSVIKPSASSVPASTAIPAQKATRTHTSENAARHAERSQTLMRHVVKKPSSTKATHAIAAGTSQPGRIIVQNGAVQQREERAKILNKSNHISKFASGSSITKVTAHVPVAAAPKASKSSAYDIANTPPTPIVIPANKPLRELHRDLFETAMHNSTSHTAKKHVIHKRRHKAARLAVAAASLLLLVGFFAYQNAPNLALKRASSTIGFTANVPTYQPSGFRRSGPVQYQPGKVTISFRSNSDSRAYTLTQASSSIDDQTIRNRFLKGQDYQTITANGQTSYLYGADNLTWTRNGIWYTIDGDSALSKDQLLNIASSLF